LLFLYQGKPKPGTTIHVVPGNFFYASLGFYILPLLIYLHLPKSKMILMLTTTTVSRLFAGFENLNVMVIGDVMVDSYIWGSVDRISPEAPVPIVAVEKRENRMGGAANVGLNVKSLGANAIMCAVIGHDQKGNEFLNLLVKEDMSNEGIVKSDDRITTTKFRVFGNHAQMLRVDEEHTEALNKKDFNELVNRIATIFNTRDIDVVIFQDYDKGVITADLIAFVVELSLEKNIPVVVDPKKNNFLNYHGVTLFKPNLKEIKEGLNIDFDADNKVELENTIGILRKRINAEMVLNTLSDKGMILHWNEGSELIPAHYRTIADVSGAGDTVISVAALCLALAAEPPDMAAIANLAGGLVCEEVGVMPIDSFKLQDEVIRILTK
jgi:rfaE bifunctional protein kinase chain/domain